MNKLAIAIVAASGGLAHANAFLLNEFDAQAVGRGNTVSATDTQPSSIYYNVGGLGASEGTAIEIGGSLIAPFATYNDPNGVKTDSNTSPQVVPGIFASSRVAPMVAVGLGFYTPFGLAISWPDTAPTNDIVHTESLHTFFITPSVGVNLGSFVPGLTAGAGVDIVPATVELTQDIFFGADKGSAHLGGTAVGIGGRIGVMYVPHSAPQLSFGAMYRSKVNLDIKGTGNFDAPAPYRGQLPPDGDIGTTLVLPQQVTVGAAWRPDAHVEVEANAIWTNWSQFKSLDIVVPTSSGGTMTIVQPRNYDNTFTFRVGAEYRMPLIGVGLRAGFIYDPTPIKPQYLTVELPDIDRLDACIGGSKSFGNYDVHLGLLWVLPTNRKTADDPGMPVYKGSYDVSAFVASVTLAGRFGPSK
jgi:long-chain fatty acid transport protein